MLENTIYNRLNDIETYVRKYKATLISTLEYGYQVACKQKDNQLAKGLILQIRDKKLEETDKYITIDNLSIDSTNIDALLKSFQDLSNNPWIKYRQGLKEIEKQEGFPFDVKFPIPPKK